jgi:hypothetical protein
MSEYERPTAISDDQRPATPMSEASPHASVAGPIAEAAHGSADDIADDGDDQDTIAQSPSQPVDDVGSPAHDRDAADASDASDPDGASQSDGRSTMLRRRKLALIGGTAAALILAAVLAPIAWESWSQKDVQIATPPRVAGLVLDDSQGAHDTIDYLRIAVQTGVALQKTTGAVYADEAGQSRSVLFIGGTGSISSPEDSLTKTFRLISDDSGGVENVQAVPAGPLGGVMRCGSTKTDGGSMAVCGWADNGSLGVAMFPNRPTDESAELLRTMRKAIQNNR